jgi:hypothetical protein
MSEPPYPGQVPPPEGQPYGQQPPYPQQPYQQMPPYPAGEQALPPAGDPLVSPDYSGWWQRTVGIVKAAWKPLLILQAIGAVVALIVRGPAAAYQAVANHDMTAARTAGTTLNFGPLFASLGLTAVGVVLTLLVGALVTLASVWVVVNTALGRTTAVGDALSRGLRRLGPLIGWQLLASLIILAGVCACVLPAVYFAAVFAVLPAVVAIERGVNPISRCFKLFHGNLGTSVSRIATIFGIFIAGGIVAAIITVPLNIASAGSGTGALVTAGFITTVVGVIVSAVLGVLSAPMTVTAYADIRSRIEPVSTPQIVGEIER